MLKQREAIVEVKTLKIDPAYKVEERLAVHKNRPDFPLYYWRAELSEILTHLPDGEAIKKDIFRALTNSVQKAFRSANDQIRETKRILNLPKSCGVLVILNENVEVLRPDYVTARANVMILEEKNGSLRFPEIAYVWIFSETHSLQVGTVPQGVPIILLEGPQSDHFPEIGDHLSSLNELWAKQSQSPLFQGRIENFNDAKFESLGKTNNADKKNLKDLSNQEIWRLAYHQDPYLRQLSELDFFAAIGRVFSELAVHFIVGREQLPRDRLMELTIGWTHGLEEAEHRRLDMRKLRAFIDRRKVPEDLIDGLLHHLSKLSWDRGI